MTLSERGEEDAGAEDPEDVLQAALLSQLPGSGGGGGGSCQPQATAAAQSDGDGSPKEDADSSHGMDSNGSTKESLDPKLSVASSEYDSEASSAGVMRSISPHYNARDDIILRFEFLRTNEMKIVIRAVWFAVLAGTVKLIVALYVKIDQPDSHYLQENTVPTINLCFAGILLSALLACWLMFFYRVYRSNLSKKRWSHRRKRAATLGGIEITLQLINCIFFIIPNAYVLGHLCSWFEPLVMWSAFVRWTIWNTIFLIFVIQAHSANPANGPYWRKYVSRVDGAVMDAPLWTHWPKLIVWVAEEATLLVLGLVLDDPFEETDWDPTITDCRQQDWNCHFKPAGIAVLTLNTVCIVTYFLLWIFFIARALNNLKHLPYNGMRMANLTTRLQIKLRGLSLTFFMLCIISYSYVKPSTCSSYIISWLGFLPMQVVMTATAIANAYMTMPKRPDQTSILQVWLQEFAWLERDIPRKKEERSSCLPPDSHDSFCLECEPLWCFETTIKLMYWSFLVYDYQEEKRQSPYSPDTALLLYGLEHWECMWERSLDTKAIVGWSSDTVVIAFRGTASLANVKADLQAWRKRWPEGVGNPLMGTAPMVHQGFHRCYTANGFNDKLLSRLEHILYRCANEQKDADSEKPVNVYVTGHSLGGALATLCAYDIKQRCPCAEYLINVKCYTFGAPRTGNHAFARIYNEAVPDTWHIINSNDVVTSAAKFWVLYKRTGHRVLVNRLGDLVVRPNYVETAVRGVPGGASVRDHLLTQYQKAIMAVVAGQFGSMSFAAGRDGVLGLAEQRGVGDVLHTAGLTRRELHVLRERGWDAYQRLVRQRAAKAKRKRSAWRRTKQDLPVQLEAVVVQEELSGAGTPLQQELPGTAGEGEQAAERPALAAAATAGDEEAAGGVEASAAAAESVVTDSTDGVLHTTQMNCRTQGGQRLHTICSLMPSREAGIAAAALPAAPQEDAPPMPQQPQAVQQLQAVAEEGDEESPPSTPHSPAQCQRRRWWQQPWKQLACALDWTTSSLATSSSDASSLASAPSSSTSSAVGYGDTRGSMGDAPAFPLVLDLGASGGAPRPGALPATAEELSGRAIQEHAEAMAAAAAKPKPAPQAGMDVGCWKKNSNLKQPKRNSTLGSAI